MPDDPLSAPDVQKAVRPLLGHRPVDAVVKLSRCLDGSLGVGWVVLADDVVLIGDRRVGASAEFRSVPVVAVESAGIDTEGLDSFGMLSLVEDETISVPLTLFDQAAFRDLTVQIQQAAATRREELKAKRATDRARAEKDKRERTARSERDKRDRRRSRKGKPHKPSPPGAGRGGVASGSRCPRCSTTLHWQYIREVRAEVCPTCSGCLLSTSTAERLARRSGSEHKLQAPRPGTMRCHGCGRPATPRHSYCGSCGAHLGLDCPACSGWMPTLAVGTIEIDVCQSCSGVWLDAGEVTRLADDPRRPKATRRTKKKQTSLEDMVESFIEMLTGGI